MAISANTDHYPYIIEGNHSAICEKKIIRIMPIS